MAPGEPWTVAEILGYLGQYNATITIRNGAPGLRVPEPVLDRWGRPVKREKITGEVLPHLIARRAEVLEYLTGEGEDVKPVAPPPLEVDADAIERGMLRGEVVDTLTARARAANKPVHWFGFEAFGKLTAGSGDVPPGAAFACVAGDAEWTLLPTIDLPPVPTETRRQKAARGGAEREPLFGSGA